MLYQTHLESEWLSYVVYVKVKARRAIVQNAIEFATVATKVVLNVTVISILQDEINKTQIDGNLAKDVLRTKKAHIIKNCDEHIYLFTSQQNLDTPIQELCFYEIHNSVSKIFNLLQKIIHL